MNTHHLNLIDLISSCFILHGVLSPFLRTMSRMQLTFTRAFHLLHIVIRQRNTSNDPKRNCRNPLRSRCRWTRVTCRSHVIIAYCSAVTWRVTDAPDLHRRQALRRSRHQGIAACSWRSTGSRKEFSRTTGLTTHIKCHSLARSVSLFHWKGDVTGNELEKENVRAT